MSSSLRATDKIQEDIEDILRKEDLYYERRVNYYSNQGIPISQIYSPLYLAKGYMVLSRKLNDAISGRVFYADFGTPQGNQSL